MACQLCQSRVSRSRPAGADFDAAGLRRGQKERDVRIPRNSGEWRSLYRCRSAVEREFGRLKHNYGLAFLRVCGIERVRLHADLTILGRLALALS